MKDYEATQMKFDLLCDNFNFNNNTQIKKTLSRK